MAIVACLPSCLTGLFPLALVRVMQGCLLCHCRHQRDMCRLQRLRVGQEEGCLAE